MPDGAPAGQKKHPRTLLDAVYGQPAVQGGAADHGIGQGHALHGDQGRRILDASAGMWCVNAGHGREKKPKPSVPKRARWTMPSISVGTPRRV